MHKMTAQEDNKDTRVVRENLLHNDRNKRTATLTIDPSL
jgi:hypothetical protein